MWGGQGGKGFGEKWHRAEAQRVSVDTVASRSTVSRWGPEPSVQAGLVVRGGACRGRGGAACEAALWLCGG